MGTLTANQSRLPDHCEHKLPASCRLSSIPNCCACADERAHSPTYRTYIDGIGFVLRGNRWDRYCWYCKEFWQNRVRVSGLDSQQTRIPETPDQTAFLERWYDFHRGYRTIISDSGNEERIAVLGEDFKDVSPGCLPRTLEELRAGRQADEVQQEVIHTTAAAETDIGLTLDETLDQMLTAAASEEQTRQQTEAPTSRELDSQPTDALRPPVIQAQAMAPAVSRSPEYEARRLAALRRELLRMRSGIYRVMMGLRELGENILNEDDSTDTIRRLDTILEAHTTTPSQTEPSTSNSTANRPFLNLQERIEEARTRLSVASQVRNNAVTDLENAEVELRSSTQQLQQLQRDQRTVENYAHVFGTREEMVAQGENYVSPIGNMFSRAYERFRAAEDVRREQRTLRQVLEDEERIDTNEALSRRLEELESREQDVWGVPRSQQPRLRSADVPALRTSDTQASRSQDVNTMPDLPSNGLYAISVIDDNARHGALTPPGPAITSSENPFHEILDSIPQPTTDEAVNSPGSSPQSGEPGREPSVEQIQEHLPSFPEDMLTEYLASRARAVAAEHAEQGLEQLAEPLSGGLPVPPARTRDISQPTENEISPRFSEDAWWHEDAELIIRTLTTDESLRAELDMSAPDAAVLLAYFIDDIVSESDRTTIDGLLRNPTAIWRAGLPAEWLSRRTELLRHDASVGLFFRGGGGSAGSDDWAAHHNPYLRLELVAQAYMTSSTIRRQASTLTPPERLQMLYRLQSGRRVQTDVAVLQQIESDEETFRRVQELYTLDTFGDEAMERAHENVRLRRRALGLPEVDATRPDNAPDRAFALAAGRRAFQTSPRALMEQMNNQAQAGETDQDAGTRAAFNRLQNYSLTRGSAERRTYRPIVLSDYATSSAESSRSASPEPSRGLDARDSGRPEPRAEEEMQVSLECKVCYTQVADIACLPCGHLVMCRWCSEQHSPCLSHDRTRPRRPAGCPVCRKGIKQKVRVFRA